MHGALQPGAPFPDLRLEERVGTMRSLSEIAAHQPLVLCFVRGWW
jgi:peroxiredoxin